MTRITPPRWHFDKLLVNGGSASDPAFKFFGNQQTGIFMGDKASLGFTRNGTEAFRVTDTGVEFTTDISYVRDLPSDTSQLIVGNTSTAPDSHAKVVVSVAGASSGDPTTTYSVGTWAAPLEMPISKASSLSSEERARFGQSEGKRKRMAPAQPVQSYTVGIDNSEPGDPYKISSGTTLGSYDLFSITPTGDSKTATYKLGGINTAGFVKTLITGEIVIEPGSSSDPTTYGAGLTVTDNTVSVSTVQNIVRLSNLNSVGGGLVRTAPDGTLSVDSTSYESGLVFSTGLTRSTNTITVNTTQNIARLSNLTSVGGGLVRTAIDGTLSVDATAYESKLTFSTGLTRSTNTITVNTTQNIARLSNLSADGFVRTSDGNGTLYIDQTTYLNGTEDLYTATVREDTKTYGKNSYVAMGRINDRDLDLNFLGFMLQRNAFDGVSEIGMRITFGTEEDPTTPYLCIRDMTGRVDKLYLAPAEGENSLLGSLLPMQDVKFDLGSDRLRYNRVYATNVALYGLSPGRIISVNARNELTTDNTSLSAEFKDVDLKEGGAIRIGGRPIPLPKAWAEFDLEGRLVGDSKDNRSNGISRVVLKKILSEKGELIEQLYTVIFDRPIPGATVQGTVRGRGFIYQMNSPDEDELKGNSVTIGLHIIGDQAKSISIKVY